MKRVLIFVLTILCVFGMSGCGRKAPVPETSAPVSVPAQTVETGSPDGEKTWSEQDIADLFSRVQKKDWEYRDCVLMPDHAGDRVGAVLFRNDQEGTSSVAFFRADGSCQQCGTYAKLPLNPGFTYLGNGTVTFQLESEDGTTYPFAITISVDGSEVNFKTESDLT